MRNTCTERSEPPVYVADKAVDHGHTMKDLVYKIFWYGYAPEKDIWEPESHIPRHFMNGR